MCSELPGAALAAARSDAEATPKEKGEPMSGHDAGPPPEGSSPHQSWTPPGTYPAGGGAPGGGPAPQAPGQPGQWGQPGQKGQPGQPGQWGQPGQPGAWAPPGPHGPVHGAAHKPGAVPLRPLGLGDIYDAAFKIIRYNPKATVGSAALVAAVAMLIPVAATAVLLALLDVDLGLEQALGGPEPGAGPSGEDLSGEDVAGLAGTFGSLLVGSFLQWLGLVLVTGMIAHVTMAAALGRRMGLGEAWAATAGRRARLVGLVVVIGLIPVTALAVYAALWVGVVVLAPTELVVVFGVVTVPVFVVLFVLYAVRVQYLAVPPMMLEGTGIRGALARALRLSRHQFWRLLGIALLTAILTAVASSILTIPLQVVNQVVVLTVQDAETLLLVYVLVQALATVVSAAFVTPFSAAVASLLYLDMRIRKEGFDVELLSAAGLPAGSPAPRPHTGPPGPG